MTSRWAACVMIAMICACKSGSGPGWDNGTSAADSGIHASSGSGGGGGANAASSGSSGGSTGSSGSGGSGGSSEGGTGPAFGDASAGSLYDAQPPPDADVGQTVTLTADPFTVAPGGEVYKCQVFANPFGRDVDLIYMDGTMSQGSHHFFLFKMDPLTLRTQPTPLQDCLGGGLEFHPFPYLSQQPHWIVQYPQPNMGYPVSAQDSLMINVHFLNASAAPIQAAVTITIMAAKPGVVTTHIGTIFLNNASFSVPPTPASSPQPYTKTWTPSSGQLPSTYNLFTSWSHMHRTAVDFQASANGTVFYDEKNWDSPQLYLHNPPMQMSGSASFSWSCSYYNDTGTTMSFGDSARTAVMCIYMGQYYPVVDPKNPDLIQAVN